MLPAFSYRCCHQAAAAILAAASIETNDPNFTIKAAAIPAVAGSCCCFTQNLLPLLLPQATGGASAQHPAVTVPAADIRVFPSRCCYCCCRQPAAVISADVPGAATTAAMITAVDWQMPFLLPSTAVPVPTGDSYCRCCRSGGDIIL